MSTWAIVVAGGSGERFGEPKQYLALGGARVLDWALRSAAAGTDGVVVVVPADRAGEPEPLASVVVAGGADPLGVGARRPGRRARRRRS